MRMRTIPALCLVALSLASCGGDDPTSYASITDMAADLQAGGVDCADATVRDLPAAENGSETLPSESGSCTSGDDTIQLFVFDDTDARDKWLNLGSRFSNDVVTGPNWTVIAPDEGSAEDIADALGGET